MEEHRPEGDEPLPIPPAFATLPEKEQAKLRRRIYLGSAAVLLFVGVAAFGLLWYVEYTSLQAQAEWQAPGVPVTLLELEPEDLEEVVEATGVVEPIQEVKVYPEVNGKVTAVKADLGDSVATGDVLVTIDDELARIRVRQMQAQITMLTARYEDAAKTRRRLEKLFERGTVSESERDQAVLGEETGRGQLAEAQAALDMALYELSHTAVRSPIAGTVTERFLEVGALASPQVPVARVANLARVKVEAGLMDGEIGRVRVGSDVVITVDACPGASLPGRVAAVGSQADAMSLTFPVRVERDNLDPGTRLLPGMIARLAINVAHHQGVIVVPRHVIQDEEGTPVAYVVEFSRARKRAVTLGPYVEGNVLVTSGLKAGDQVVVVGHEMLHDGRKVRIDEGP